MYYDINTITDTININLLVGSKHRFKKQVYNLKKYADTYEFLL